MFGPGIPGSSLQYSSILGAGVHVRRADEVRQRVSGKVSNITTTNSVMGSARNAPRPPSNQAQKMKDRNIIVGEMLSPRHLIQKYQAAMRRQQRARSPLESYAGKPVAR